MIKQDIIKLEDILSRGIEKFVADGGKLITNSFGNECDQCCAISATTDLRSREGPREDALSQLLGVEVSREQMFCIACGFDGNSRGSTVMDYRCESADDLYQVGLNLRNKYLVKQ